MQRARIDEGSFERGEEPVGVDLGEADKRTDTSSEGIVPEYIVREGLHDGHLEGGDGFIPKNCSHCVN